MAEDQTLPQVQACRLRVTKLSAAGVPVTGADQMYVTDALVRVGFEPVYADGEEIQQKNGCGENFVDYRGLDSFRRGNLTIQLVSPDPELAEMLSDGTVLDDATRKGFASPAIGIASGDAVSVEAWAKRIRDGVLDADSPYAWWAYPYVTNMRLSGHSLENGAQLPEFSGQCYENANWGGGPEGNYPVDGSKVFQWFPTATLPAAASGYQAVV